MTEDILFKTKSGIFSYRVAGVLIHDGKVLLQRTLDDPAYAYPGGHVNFGETSEAALIREFKEEAGIDILIERLLWVGEVFFPWGPRNCHQVSLYYLVKPGTLAENISDRSFLACDEVGDTRVDLEFSWVPLPDIPSIEIYPLGTKEWITNPSEGIKHFIAEDHQA